MEITVAKAYPKRRNCRKKPRLRTPSAAATTMVIIPRISRTGAANSNNHKYGSAKKPILPYRGRNKHRARGQHHIEQALLPARALAAQRLQVRWHFRPAHRVGNKVNVVVRAFIAQVPVQSRHQVKILADGVG